MADAAVQVLLDGFGRVHSLVSGLLEGADDAELLRRPGPRANTPAWLLWHLARVQDDHVAQAFGSEQVWTSGSWVERFGLPFPPEETGYGMSPDEVSQVRVPAELLAGYEAAVYGATVPHLGNITDEDLQRVVDDSYKPPVTLGMRLVSVLADDLQHVGQAAYVLGLD
jgi:hypothetical protein